MDGIKEEFYIFILGLQLYIVSLLSFLITIGIEEQSELYFIFEFDIGHKK